MVFTFDDISVSILLFKSRRIKIDTNISITTKAITNNLILFIQPIPYSIIYTISLNVKFLLSYYLLQKIQSSYGLLIPSLLARKVLASQAPHVFFV